MIAVFFNAYNPRVNFMRNKKKENDKAALLSVPQSVVPRFTNKSITTSTASNSFREATVLASATVTAPVLLAVHPSPNGLRRYQ
jgi:hypothetical protein